MSKQPKFDPNFLESKGLLFSTSEEEMERKCISFLFVSSTLIFGTT